MNKRKAWTVSYQNIAHSAAGVSTSAGMLLNEKPLKVLTCLCVTRRRCVRFLVSRAAVTGDAVVLGLLSGSMDGWSGSTVMKSFLWLSNHVGPASLPRSRSSSLILRAVGRVEMVWKGKWRLALWLFWHTIQALTAQFSAQVIPVQNNRIWLWLNRTFLRLL